MQKAQIWEFTQKEKQLVRSLVAKGRAEQARNEKFAIIDFESFFALFSDDEIAIMKRWQQIDPKSIGYRLPFLGALDSVDNIVPIADQKFTVDGKVHIIPCQYLPEAVHGAYKRLNTAMHKEIAKKLLILYGYRSPARQVFIFFDILERIYDFDFNKTIQRVCFPDYSEHVCTQLQAIDFITQEGLPGETFNATTEYVWLQENARQYGFTESYPKDNDLDMMYEPWHWRYEAGV